MTYCRRRDRSFKLTSRPAKCIKITDETGKHAAYNPVSSGYLLLAINPLFPDKNVFTRFAKIRIFCPTKLKMVVYFEKPDDTQRVAVDHYIGVRP